MIYRALLVQRMRRVAERKFPSQAAYARHLGVSPGYLSDVFSGRRDPGPKLLRAWGYSKVNPTDQYYSRNASPSTTEPDA